jgi:tetratricopeptide (TPR) repeat protein
VQNIAAIYFERKQYDEAEKYMKLAIKLNPSAALYSNLGIIYKDASKKDQAKQMFEKALEIDPAYDTARKYLEKL